MKYKLAPYVFIGFEGKKLCFGFGSIQKKIEDNIEEYLKALAYIKEYRTIKEIKEYLSNNISKKEIADKVFNDITDKKIIINDKTYNKEERYSRQKLFLNMSGADANLAQEKILNKHVVVLGCGGIGNIISVNLVTAGVGKITLIDNDIIEESNLTRQYMFKESDIGKLKIDILAEELKSRNSNSIIEKFPLSINRYEDLSIIPKCDLIILSADKPWELTDWVNEYCIKNKVPFINVGYVNDISVWGPFVIPGKSGCLSCQDLFADTNVNSENINNMIRTINSGYQSPSIGAINMISASFAALDVIKYFSNIEGIASINKRVGIWTHDLHIETQDCSLNRNCKVCGDSFDK